MKKLSKMKKVIICILLSIFCFINVLNVDALEQSIKLAKAEKINTPYIGGVTFSYKKTISGEYLYCLDMHKDTASNINANVVGKRDNGITTILLNGYPNKSITGNQEKDYYITQTAIWWYLDETTGSSNLGEQFKSDGSDSYNMRSKVKELVDLGKANKENTTNIDTNNSLSINTNNKELILKGDYYESELITIEKTEQVSNIEITLTNTPEGTLIIDKDGNEIKDFNNIDSFYIRIPKSLVTSSSNYNITVIGKTNSYQAYEYQPVDKGMQNVTKLDKDTQELSDSVTFNTSIEYVDTPDTSTTSLIITIVGILILSTGIVVIRKYEKQKNV